MVGYWVKGYPWKSAAKTEHNPKPAIHHFDTLKEAIFFKGQVAEGEILNWGDGEKLSEKEKGGTMKSYQLSIDDIKIDDNCFDTIVITIGSNKYIAQGYKQVNRKMLFTCIKKTRNGEYDINLNFETGITPESKLAAINMILKYAGKPTYQTLKKRHDKEMAEMETLFNIASKRAKKKNAKWDPLAAYTNIQTKLRREGYEAAEKFINTAPI